MVQKSTLLLLAGVGLLFVPVPPIATVLGALVVLVGAAFKLFSDEEQ